MSFLIRSKIDERNAKLHLAESYNELSQKFSTYSQLQEVGNYQIIKQIGEGGFGKVYLAVHKFLHSKVVLKQGRKDDPNVVREVYYQREFKHPNITKLYEVIVSDLYIYMVLEYCPDGELYDYLIQNKRLSVPKLKKIFSQICSSVYYIHQLGSCHRDLKLENILVDRKKHMKLSDFGFTRELPGKKESNMVLPQLNSLLETICGTTVYMAPELIEKKAYSGIQIDIWSLGVILYTLTYGGMPFDEDDDLKTKYKVLHVEPSYKEDVPNDLIDLIKLLLQKDVQQRPQSLYQVLQHPFLQPYGMKQMELVESILSRQIKPFQTKLEKNLLKKLARLHFDTKNLMESVVEKKCDSVAGLWELMLEKEKKMELQKRKKISRSRSVLRFSQAIASSSPIGHTRKGSYGTNQITLILSNTNNKDSSEEAVATKPSVVAADVVPSDLPRGPRTTRSSTLNCVNYSTDLNSSPTKSTLSSTPMESVNQLHPQVPNTIDVRNKRAVSLQEPSSSSSSKKYNNILKRLGHFLKNNNNNTNNNKKLDSQPTEIHPDAVDYPVTSTPAAAESTPKTYDLVNNMIYPEEAPETPVSGTKNRDGDVHGNGNGKQLQHQLNGALIGQDSENIKIVPSPTEMRRSSSINSNNANGRQVRPASMVSTYSSFSQLTTMSETSIGSDNNASFSTENTASFQGHSSLSYRPQYDRARSSEFSVTSRLSNGNNNTSNNNSKYNDLSSNSSTTNISRSTSIDSSKSNSIRNRGRAKSLKKNATFFVKRGKSPIGYSNRFAINKRKMGLLNSKKTKSAVIQEEYESSLSNSTSNLSLRDNLEEEEDGELHERVPAMENQNGLKLNDNNLMLLSYSGNS